LLLPGAASDLQKGDKCRRLILYADSLGETIPASQIAEVRSWAAGAQLGSAPFEPPYYSSTLPPGAQRLADNLTESAFFTKIVATKCQFALWFAFGMTLVGAASALLLADLLGSPNAGTVTVLAKSIGVFITFLISGDFALLAKKYGDLAAEARVAYEACARLRLDAQATLEEVRSVSDDYGAAVLQAPPIPAWLYMHYQGDLNRMYRDSHS
jgi:hypothetical protein